MDNINNKIKKGYSNDQDDPELVDINKLKIFQLAVNGASDHIVITDSQGIILFANPAVENITGYHPSEIIGKKAGSKQLWGGLMTDDFYVRLWKTIKQDKKVFKGEITNKRKNGRQYNALSSISPITDNQNNVLYFVGIERDISIEKEIDRMKTEFISLVSHQLKTPLTSIKWFLELLFDKKTGGFNKKQAQYLNNINQSTENMIALVNALLNVSRIESGRIIIDPKPTNITEIIRDVVKEVTPKLNEKKQKIIVNIDPEIPLINLDYKLIRNVYLNLITNGIKYSRQNGEINVSIKIADDKLLSRISDTGYGIAKEDMSKIFTKFFRADNISGLQCEGTGLGLYMVKQILNASGGKIWFNSKLNQGSDFYFSIPISGMNQKNGSITLA